MLQNKYDVYQMLTQDTLWVAYQLSIVIGDEVLYAPTRSVFIQESSEDWKHYTRNVQAEISYTLHIDGRTPTTYVSENQLKEEIYRQAHELGVNNIVFQGYYRQDIDIEKCAQIFEDVAETLRTEGFSVWLSDPESWIYWHNKGNFRQEVVNLYGEEALPKGKSWESPRLEQLQEFAHSHFQESANALIFKSPAEGGGYGNVIVKSESDIGNLQENLDFSWVVAEEWKPWTISPCTSFFSNENNEPIYMEMCGQRLDDEGGFKGSNMDVPLSDRDKEKLIEYQRPLAKRMFDTGIQGFVGIDTILSESHSNDMLFLPDSGMSVNFIEANPRTNGHNKERLFIQHLANREQINSERILHSRAPIAPIEGLNHEDRNRVWEFFTHHIEGWATPLSQDHMELGHVYFTIGSKYSNLLLFGIDITGEQMDAVYHHLKNQGVCAA